MKVKYGQRGRFNRQYWSVVFVFDKTELRFDQRNRILTPSAEDIVEMVKHCILVEPQTKRLILYQMFDEAINKAVNDTNQADVQVSFKFNKADKHFCAFKRDYMPKHSELSDMITNHMKLSDSLEFYDKLRYVMDWSILQPNEHNI